MAQIQTAVSLSLTTLVLLHYWRASQTDHWKHWLLLGCEIGLLLLTSYAGLILIVLLLIGQCLMMAKFLKAPIEKALWYSGFGVPLYVSGMMVSAFALRGLG